MVIYITNFQTAKQKDLPNPYSIARWQPAGFDYPELRFWAPFRPDGVTPIYWKNKTPEQYKVEYMEAIGTRFFELSSLRAWLNRLTPGDNLSLCCWCSQSNRTFCHSELVGQIIQSIRPDIEVVYVDIPRYYK